MVDISSVPVIGLDRHGFCAGGGVYQIKSKQWPLQDLLAFLSAGVLGLFVAGMAPGSAKGFHRFQKKQLANIPLPCWRQLKKNGAFVSKLRAARAIWTNYSVPSPSFTSVVLTSTLRKYVARDWKTFLEEPGTPRRP